MSIIILNEGLMEEYMVAYLTRKWHWFDYSIVLLRLFWYLINLFIIVTSPNLGMGPIWMVTFFTIAYLVPQCFHLPKSSYKIL